jgi:hypothetical protein
MRFPVLESVSGLRPPLRTSLMSRPILSVRYSTHPACVDRIRRFAQGALAAVALLAATQPGLAAPDGSDGFEAIFDGKTLEGWRGQDMSFWSVEDEAITATITQQHPAPMNQYLVWLREPVRDFELKLEFRFAVSSAGNENGGFQFRSRRLPNGDVAGYQVDNNLGTPWKVRLYDEHGRHDLAFPGERAVFDDQGRRRVEKLEMEPGATDFRLEDWHEYDLLAQGPHLALRINGRFVAEAFDRDPENIETSGVLALQLHTGPPMKVQFRNIRIKRLLAPEPAPGERLLAEAALHWEFGERIASHQPPLKALGTITPGVAEEGVGAIAGRHVARFEQAAFDANIALNDARTWNVPGKALTVLVRAHVADGNWANALVSKGGSPDRLNFRLFGTDRPETPGPDIAFAIRTDRGLFQVEFPIGQVDPKAWHDLVGRYDGRRLQILCDGRVMAECPASGAMAANREMFLVGAETLVENGPPARFLTGEMERAALWCRALTDAEVGSLMVRLQQAAP